MKAREILRKAEGPAVATDDGNRILGLNRAARELLGYGAKSAVSRNLSDLVQTRDTFGNRLSPAEPVFLEMIGRGEPIQSFEIQVRKASGENLRVAVSVVIVLGSESEPATMVYLLTPVLRRRKADEVIERLLATSGTAWLGPAERRINGDPNGGPRLTARQLEVLELMAQGASTSQMAEALGVSVTTIRTHIQRILQRLHVHSQLEAVSVARRERLI